MERLSIKTPADFISLMGHSLGFWPQESLVCVTLDGQRIGATVRVDLPAPGTDTNHITDQMLQCITTDAEATGVVVGLFTKTRSTAQAPRPHEALIDELITKLQASDIALRDGWLIGPSTFTNYLTLTDDFPVMHPLTEVASSELNAELVYRGSSVETTPGFHRPIFARTDLTHEIRKHCDRIEDTTPNRAIARARDLWKNVIDDGGREPSDAQAAELIANFQFIPVRDHLLADIPGLNQSMRDVLLGQTTQGPHWQRVDRAAEVLMSLYTKTDKPAAAPILTSLGVIHWWEGHGTKAHACFQHALEADPSYKLAELMNQLVSNGIICDWATNRAVAYQPPHTRGPEIGGIGMG